MDPTLETAGTKLSHKSLASQAPNTKSFQTGNKQKNTLDNKEVLLPLKLRPQLQPNTTPTQSLQPPTRAPGKTR